MSLGANLEVRRVVRNELHAPRLRPFIKDVVIVHPDGIAFLPYSEYTSLKKLKLWRLWSDLLPGSGQESHKGCDRLLFASCLSNLNLSSSKDLWHDVEEENGYLLVFLAGWLLLAVLIALFVCLLLADEQCMHCKIRIEVFRLLTRASRLASR